MLKKFVVVWYRVIIVSALSLSLRDKERFRDWEIERAWQLNSKSNRMSWKISKWWVVKHLEKNDIGFAPPPSPTKMSLLIIHPKFEFFWHLPPFLHNVIYFAVFFWSHPLPFTKNQGLHSPDLILCKLS